MRKIDLNKVKPDSKWNKKAVLEQKNIDQGKKEPKKAANIWSSAKPRLKAVSFDKCWYCEAKEERSDDAVDHFRPKSLYPWLACNLKNFRYACTFCNSLRSDPETGETKGKGDQFPLFSGTRASKANELEAERYVLIDPCKAGDVGLLDFSDDGRVSPKYPSQVNRKRRAIDSIKAYHLNHSELVEIRRQLALQIADWVKIANTVYDDLDQDDPEKHEVFSGIAESIGRAITSDAPYSVFAKKIVKGYRNHPWVEDLLDCA